VTLVIPDVDYVLAFLLGMLVGAILATVIAIAVLSWGLEGMWR
jgi:hypothetical protein